jgi:hypothetical protein
VNKRSTPATAVVVGPPGTFHLRFLRRSSSSMENVNPACAVNPKQTKFGHCEGSHLLA